MKKTYILLIVVSLFIISNLNFAQQKGFGLGVVLGEPTGISAKFWLTPGTALDFGLGYSFTSSNSVFDFYADYVFYWNIMASPRNKLRCFCRDCTNTGYNPGNQI